MAMKPFCGYNYGDYFAHWLSFDQPGAHLPKVFHVNWFRKGADGKFLWPGFGDNLRVLEWMLKRVNGEVGATETPVGLLPHADDLNTEGLHLADGSLDTLLEFDAQGWQKEIAAIGEYLDGYGAHLPEKLGAEQQRVAEALKGEAGETAAPARKAAAVS
jgi:phosphoenolpyruvate carboxykinase (GTP)